MSASRPALRAAVPTVRRLEAASVSAAWGDPALLAGFTDRPAPAGPDEAELWYGTHPRHASRVDVGGHSCPGSELPEVEQPRLLVKLLAAGAPLSIQVHPDDPAALRGFAAEDALGVPTDARERRYVDASGKPELIRAVAPMRVLCGLRPAHESRALLSRLVPEGGDVLLETLARGDAGLVDAVATLLRADAATVERLLAAVAAGAHGIVTRAADSGPDDPVVEPRLERAARLALDLQERYPGDAGVLIALLMDDVDLAPGDALWVAPGTPHAYLSGLGVEVMACSDNVVRAGLTVKPVDTDEFLALLDPSAVGARHVGTLPRSVDGPGWRRTILPEAVFVVDEADLDGVLAVERSGPGASILLCLTGEVAVRGRDGSAATIGPGGAVLLAPGHGAADVEGLGHVVHASPVSPGTGALTSV